MSALEQVTGLAALGAGLAAVVAGTLTLLATRRPLPALGVLLDLLLAAGLLRLSGDPDWRVILTAAAIITLRHLIGAGLRAGGRSWSGGTRSGGAPGGTTAALRSVAGAGRAVAGRVLARPAWRR